MQVLHLYTGFSQFKIQANEIPDMTYHLVFSFPIGDSNCCIKSLLILHCDIEINIRNLSTDHKILWIVLVRYIHVTPHMSVDINYL